MRINIILLFVLIVSTAAIAQKPFSPIYMNEKGQKELIESSTLIIEAKIIKSKGPIFDNNTKGGYFYSLYVIKPTAVLKGNSDTTRAYQFLVEKGDFSFPFDPETGQYGSNYYLNSYGENAWIIPNYGIFFINENPAPVKNNFWIEIPGFKLVPVDLYSLFPKATMIGFKNCISYNKKCPKEQTLKYLLDKFNLKAIPLQ